jgi:two-component system, OmpR family, copper resistance phosphate regulon response regulator CusR
MRILIVEDEQKTAAYLRKGLAENGYVVDVAGNGIDGGHLAQSQDYDLILLDVMLPGVDGWTLMQNLRLTRQTPVLFMTAKGGVEDRVKGLELGADDYLVKPFAFSELLARVRSVLRRGAVRQPEVIKLEDLEVDLLRRKVQRGGRRIDLTTKEFGLLSLLIRRTGEVLSRTVIAEQVWDMNFDSDTNVVDVAIRRLRAKIDEPFEHRLIHNVRGVGYVIEQRA